MNIGQQIITNILNEYGKWSPSKKAKAEFAKTMTDIENFCNENNIDYSKSMDSYYFTINGQKYRVSNHTVDTSNRAAYDDIYGQKRELYHPNGEEDDIIYITASKTRIKDIYNALKDGKKLDRRGNIINESVDKLWYNQMSNKSEEELKKYLDKLYKRLANYNDKNKEIKSREFYDLLDKINYIEDIVGKKPKLGRVLK